MAMVVKNNMSAVNTLNTLNKNQSLLGKSLQKVSSGMKINSAQDDASGYAISERMRVMIRSLDQANQNTQNGSSLMKVAEGAVSNTVEILKTLKEKAINAATDTNTEEDRAIIQKEINQLVDQVDDNALITFNGKYLLDGSKSAAGNATYNTWTNQALAEDTTGSTKLVDLKSRGGEELTIETSDKVTVSYVQNGRTYTTTQIIGEMKNATLAGVFKLAEDIDTDTTTFAVASNESIKTVGSTDQLVTDRATVEAAIAKLQDALSYKNTPGYVNLGTLESVQSYIKVDYSTPGSENITTDTAQTTTTSTTGATLEALESTSLGMKSTYNGDITLEVTSALEAYRNAVAAAGTSTTVGAAGILNSAIDAYNAAHSGANITWSGSEGGLDDFEATAKAVGGDVLAAFTNYKAAVDKKAATKESLDNAVKSFNEGLAQLDALLVLKTLEEKKEAYLAGIETYLTAVDNTMSASANANNTYTLPAGIAGNKTALTYTASTDETSKKTEILNALREKLTGLLDEMSIIGEASGDKKLETAVKGVIDSTTSAFNVSGSAVDSVTAGALQDFENTATDVDTAAATITTAKYGEKLKLVYDGTLSDLSGPALLIGSNVGLDAAGKTVSTINGQVGLTFTAATAGADGQISGFTISISDSDGNVRKSVNTSLNAWSTTIYGKNASEKDNSLAFQIGAAANQTITVDMADMRAEAIGLKGKDGKVVDVSTKENANAAISVFENALQKALDVQTTIGAIEARLEYTASNLTTSTENVQAAESTIRDADMAKEMTNYTKNNVLLQAAQSMLAQANQNSSAVLSLLQ